MDVRVDGVPRIFDSTEVAMTATSSVVTLTALGRIDPTPGILDTGSSIQLVLAFDRAAVFALEAPVTLEIDGTTTYDANGNVGMDPFEWRGDPAAVVDAWLEVGCFCIAIEEGDQGIEGSVRFDTLTGSTIAGRLTVTATGAIPNAPLPAAYQVDVEFDQSGL